MIHRYKAWLPKEERMVQVSSIDFPTETITAQDETGRYRVYLKKQGDFTLLQYTGLKTGKGRFIYVGDLLSDNIQGSKGFGWIEMDWGLGAFVVKGKTTTLLGQFLKDYPYVHLVGNRFENTKLFYVMREAAKS